MRKKMIGLILCVLMVATVFLSGLLSVPAAAAGTTYKTENVEVPEGWDYIEVSTAKELEDATPVRYDARPVFIRLMSDIEVSNAYTNKDRQTLIIMDCYKSVILDLNGHKIRGYITAPNNADNHNWTCLNVRMSYGLYKDLYFRIVDSQGGGGVSLDAYTYIDGPTTALLIHGFSLRDGYTRYSVEETPYNDQKVRVYIDGGEYTLHTDSEKWGHPLDPYKRYEDANGALLWNEAITPYTRSAVGIEDCITVINNGHFKAMRTAGDKGTDYGARYISDLGITDSYALSNLRINNGTFDGERFAVYYYWYTSGVGYEFSLPILNGGTYKGGIMLCSTQNTWWNNDFDMWGLNDKMKDIKISRILLNGAKMYIEGTKVDPEKKDLEDVGWPHEVTITPGPDIYETALEDSTVLLNKSGVVYLQTNMKPDSIKLQKYVRTIRNGQDYYIWNEVKNAIWQPVSGEENYYKVQIPTNDKAEVCTYQLVASFGDINLISDTFKIEWLDYSDHGFTYGPETFPSIPGESSAYALFNYSHPEDLMEWSLWWLKGEIWHKIEGLNFLQPDYSGYNHYLLWFTELPEEGMEDATYCIELEYRAGKNDTYTVTSPEFKFTKDMIGEYIPSEETESPEDTDETVITPPEGAPEGSILPFTDVYPEDKFYNSVCWAYFTDPQVTTGKTATLFGPYDTVTRGQAVTFLWRALGCPEPEGDPEQSKFVDLNAGYYKKAVQWAVENGITKGVDSTHFNPDGTLSTAHMATFLFRTLGIGDDGWYEPAGWWVHDIGLQDFTGLDTDPKIDCPRYCTVMMLQYTVGYNWPPEN